MTQQQQTPKTVIFLHIPKTAGTTLHRIIKRQYPEKAIFSITADVGGSLSQLDALSESEKLDIQMLKGHMDFGLHQRLPNPSRYFTIFREPIDRVVSYYYHILRSPNHPFHPQITENNLSLRDCLEQGFDPSMENYQTRMLAGVWGSLAFGECTEETLATAKTNLREWFEVVGLTERFDETLLLLKQAFGWHNITYKRENVARNRPGIRKIDAETMALLQAANQLDKELYVYAQSLFEQQVAAQGAAFIQAQRWLVWQNKVVGLYRRARQVSVRTMLRQRLGG
ncbi:MAG: sulfotransferase family 2 domain-containing protein [Chloroflexi bacterium]|nr:sulfotransferase family 2 domain-containing protein [Chloroflexota bacterium]